MVREVRIGVVLAALVSLSGPARGADAATCFDAHVRAQLERRDGKLRAARATLELCARGSCPGKVQKDCAEWLLELGELVPSVIVKARDAQGAETAAVEVFIDGESVAKELDGRPIELDPGEHRFRFVDGRGKVLEQRVVMREGEQRRELLADFAPPRAATPRPQATPPPASGPPALAYVFAGASVVAFGSFGYFAVSGRRKQDELEKCAPDCDLDEVHAMRRQYLAADISLGIAAATAGIAVYLTLSDSSRGPRVGVRPGRRSVISLGTRF